MRQRASTDSSLTSAETGLRRSLSNRQLQMLAIGGVIGVGLFYGASLSVKMAGPGVLIGFLACGLAAAIVMRALGEMTVEKPVSGSFSEYAGKHLGAKVGFVTGGMWWFYWVATVMSELAAIGKLIQFWFPTFPAWVPGLIALVLFTASNLFAVKVFGELEYWFAILKILAIVVFMVFGLLMMFTGVFTSGNPVGLTNLWKDGGFLPHGWFGVIASISLVIQAYSGIETLAVEAGESKDPARSMPKAFRRVTLRILVLYVGSIFVMLAAFPWTYLIHHPGSPYVVMFSRAGIPIAAGLVNLLIILSGLSSCNTGLYGGSRMLYSLSIKRHGQQVPNTVSPKTVDVEDSWNAEQSNRVEQSGRVNESDPLTPVTQRLNQNQVPHVAVWLTAAAISVGILITYLAPNNVYIWITSASAFASLWTWGIILVSELAWRSKVNRQGLRPQFAMPWWPTLPILGLLILIFSFLAMVVSPYTRISVFSGVIFLVLLFIYPSKQREAK